jgi:hypothetical protein
VNLRVGIEAGLNARRSDRKPDFHTFHALLLIAVRENLFLQLEI